MTTLKVFFFMVLSYFVFVVYLCIKETIRYEKELKAPFIRREKEHREFIRKIREGKVNEL